MRPLLFFCLIFLTNSALCQDKSPEWYLTASTNGYLPRSGSSKSTFPVIGYNRDVSPKFLVGGFGIGATVRKPLTSELHIQGKVNFSRQVYWEEPMPMQDLIGATITFGQMASPDYVLNIGATAHYHLSPKLYVGTGLGTQVMLLSLSRTPEVILYGYEPTKSKLIINNYYKRFTPVLPLEISYLLKNTLINLRYDLGLTGRLKGELGKSTKERFSLLTLEVGFKLK